MFRLFYFNYFKIGDIKLKIKEKKKIEYMLDHRYDLFTVKRSDKQKK